MTVLLVWNFVFNLLNLLRGLVPAVTLFSSLIYAFGAFSVMMFFFALPWNAGRGNRILYIGRFLGARL
jgi:hypothetical protein